MIGNIILILICILIATIIIYYINKMRMNKKEINFMIYKENLNVNIDELALASLDALIVECHTEYIQKNLLMDKYISNAQEVQITRDVCTMVQQRISPILVDKLSVVYSKLALGEIIANKVYFFNMAYVIDNNFPKEQKTIIPKNKG